MERGDVLDEAELLLQNGEARDDISALPRNIGVKILTYLSIVDLLRCAQVCRSWKMMVNSNVLWSKVSFYFYSLNYYKKFHGIYLFRLIYSQLKKC